MPSSHFHGGSGAQGPVNGEFGLREVSRHEQATLPNMRKSGPSKRADEQLREGWSTGPKRTGLKETKPRERGSGGRAGKPPFSVLAEKQLIGPSRGRLLILGDWLLFGGPLNSRRVEVHLNGEVDEFGQHLIPGLTYPSRSSFPSATC